MFNINVRGLRTDCFLTMKNSCLLLAAACSMLLASCSTKLAVRDVSYQSVCNVRQDQIAGIPENAVIALFPVIDENGKMSVVVKNLTDEIMVIDRTKSFFVNSDGVSTVYYDPTVKTTSSTVLNSGTKGVGVNLGAVGSALGVSGALGTALNGINVGGSSTSGNSVTNTTYTIDQPSASLAPKGQADMGRVFSITGIGESFLEELSSKAAGTDIYKPHVTDKESYCKFSVCVSYSLDGGKTFEKIVSDYYTNSIMLANVRSNGDVNASLRKIYENKANALSEPWFLLHFNANIEDTHNTHVNNALYDYK